MTLDSEFLSLVEQIETRFPVSAWRAGDTGMWPLARMDLYLDLYWRGQGSAANPRRLKRAAEHLARPLTNLWNQRRDLSSLRLLPRRADAVLLGDGVSLEKIGGAWEDRYGEPLMALLEEDGQACFRLQAGDMRRAPWRHPTFAANMIEAAGQVLARRYRTSLALPDHGGVMQLLAKYGVTAPSLDPARLARRAAVLHATAALFERMLDVIRPRLAFTVTWYAGLGPAFLLACRRQGILSVDLQHCPQQGRHKAYRWNAVPDGGYALLPAVFWTWDQSEAAHIRDWAKGPWHRALAGGHARRDALLDGPAAALPGNAVFEREILVALQTLHSSDGLWDALADKIETAPASWRWWIRRHPAARPEDDARFGRLLALRGDRIRIDEASSVTLPELLRHMSAVLSLSSGVGAEAAPFGVPALSLEGNLAEVIPKIAALPTRPSPPVATSRADPGFALSLLSGLAGDYARLCAGA